MGTYRLCHLNAHAKVPRARWQDFMRPPIELARFVRRRACGCCSGWHFNMSPYCREAWFEGDSDGSSAVGELPDASRRFRSAQNCPSRADHACGCSIRPFLLNRARTPPLNSLYCLAALPADGQDSNLDDSLGSVPTNLGQNFACVGCLCTAHPPWLQKTMYEASPRMSPRGRRTELPCVSLKAPQPGAVNARHELSAGGSMLVPWENPRWCLVCGHLGESVEQQHLPKTGCALGVGSPLVTAEKHRTTASASWKLEMQPIVVTSGAF